MDGQLFQISILPVLLAEDKYGDYNDKNFL
jgi:hypothetical protein